eukprot:123132_1
MASFTQGNIKWILTSTILALSIIFEPTITKIGPDDPYKNWKVGTSTLPRPLAQPAVGYDKISNLILLVGGASDTHIVEYNMTDDSFSDIVPQLSPNELVSGHFVQVNKYLYITNTNVLMRFNVETREMNYNWSVTGTPKGGIICYLDIDDGYLVLSGGSSPVGTVKKLSLASLQWSDLPSLQPGRAGHTCQTYNTSIFIFGGYISQGVTTDSIAVLDFYGGWKTLSKKLSQPLANFRSFMIDDKIVIIGGRIGGRHGYRAPDINVFNVLTNQIDGSSSSIEPGMMQPGIINVNRRIYIFGGNSELNPKVLDSWRYLDVNSYSPTVSPSQPPTSATSAPSNAPVQPPTTAPTNAPSSSPTTCYDYDKSSYSLDGNSKIITNGHTNITNILPFINQTENIWCNSTSSNNCYITCYDRLECRQYHIQPQLQT